MGSVCILIYFHKQFELGNFDNCQFKVNYIVSFTVTEFKPSMHALTFKFFSLTMFVNNPPKRTCYNCETFSLNVLPGIFKNVLSVLVQKCFPLLKKFETEAVFNSNNAIMLQ